MNITWQKLLMMYYILVCRILKREVNTLAVNGLWEDGYKNIKQLWGVEPDLKLIQYFDLIKKGYVLDLGIGEGRNALPFAISGFNIEGVDISETALNQCKEEFEKINININLTCSDLRNYNINKNNYTLIIASNVLNFFKKEEIEIIIQNMKAGLKEEGIIYLSVFSTLDPKFHTLQATFESVEENTFYVKNRETYIHYFTKEEITGYFSDFEIISVIESFEYDDSHGSPHYHGGIELMVRKKKCIDL
jgi:2-polyprenyl-3-methyl-5-hydroxy-6-metoxy-1,4-benzoquinol methylase